ncbi:MAG: class I SAM-dependent methyltransferase [Bacteroidetes bacterium]|nr:class I SAM-dependent methyltransferase [Bacteroidota bacterium]
MYTSFQLAKKYLQYYLTASNGKGHGVHSPFVFNFITKVLNDRTQYEEYNAIELLRKKLLSDKNAIEVEDFGAGSSVIKSNQRLIGKIAVSSLKPKKYAQLLYRIARYYQPSVIVELGTSLGITTAYLAQANKKAHVYTLEGARSIAAIARSNFHTLSLSNVTITEGNFSVTLPDLLQKLPVVDLAFVDGNHRKEPTLQYFQQLLLKTSPQSILVFDDIHWSKEMEEAWEIIQQHPSVTLSIDLFFIGLVFFSPEYKVKQEFTIRY